MFLNVFASYNVRADAENEIMSETGVTTDLFRSAWSNYATGVTVISTIEADGETVHGMTANSVNSISLEPPLASITVGHERNTHPLVKRNGRFGLSVLAFDQRGIARHYTVPEEIRRTLSPPEFEPLGESMVLTNALAAMDCRVVDSFEAGDHTIFIAEVESIRVNDGEPLLYFRSRFAAVND